jgi:hypothetical protein
LLFASSCAALCVAEEARATENEWHVGGAFGYAMLVSSVGSIHGGGGMLHFRYGLTDALDLAFDAGVSGFPSQVLVPEIDEAAPDAPPADPVTIPELLVPDTAGGVSYVIDVGRFIPHVGVQVGVADVIVLSCEEDPNACTHTVRATIGIPGGFEVRTVGPLVLGAHIRYQFLLTGDPGGALFAGAYAALVP